MPNPSPRDIERRLDDLGGVDGREGPDRVTFTSTLVGQDKEPVGEFHQLTVERDGRGWESEQEWFDVEAE